MAIFTPMTAIEILNSLLNENLLWENEIVFRRNEYLASEGTINTFVYFVISGSLRIYTLDGNEENTIRFGYKDSFITAIDSFFTERPTGFYIQALKKTTAKVISKKVLLEFIESDASRLKLWNSILSLLIVQQMEREKDLLISSPAERYKSILNRSPQLFQEIPDKYIASYLRMTAETFSRIKKS